jgi:biotin synthase
MSQAKSSRHKEIIRDLVDGKAASLSELAMLLEEADAAMLCAQAGDVCRATMQGRVQLRAIIEFSSYCRCHCTYCGLFADNVPLQRYRMTREEIYASAQEAYAAGYRTIILQSGEDPFYDAEMIAEFIRDIKGLGEIAVVLSIGERPASELEKWYQAGADRYLLKHETSDASLYRQLHQGADLSQRLAVARTIKNIGYQLGGGFMVGLPGQTFLTLAGDILLLKSLGVEMAGIGPFIAHPATPLAGTPSVDPALCLKVLALTRILLPLIHLPATTALATLDTASVATAMQSGANVIMRKVEPVGYRGMYDIYPRPKAEMRSVKEQWRIDEAFIRSLGMTVDQGRGDGYEYLVKAGDQYV